MAASASAAPADAPQVPSPKEVDLIDSDLRKRVRLGGVAARSRNGREHLRPFAPGGRMSRESAVQVVGKLSFIAGLALALGVLAPASAFAQQDGTDGAGARAGAAAPGRRRCPTCAPLPASPRTASRNVSARRGGDHTPSTDASIFLGKARYQGRVDADCAVQ